jgi:glutamate carboxypeptidase
MHALLRYAKTQESEIVSLIGELVECESPSDDKAAVNRFVSLVAERTRDIAKPPKRHRAGAFGDHARVEFVLPGARKEGRVLALAHSDTVWPLGTLRQMPFRRHRGRLWGPGVYDMKAGIAFFLFAVRALRELKIPVRRNVMMQINSDEEVGSPSSRSLTEEAASHSNAVLVLEPAQGPGGHLKTARKGVGDYEIRVHGRASHAGVDFEAGASAVLELARQLQRVAGFTNLARGITVNPGVISGGTRSNVVAAEARAEVDVRIARLADARSLHRRFIGLRPFDSRCSIDVTGGLNRPPMERTAPNRRLYGVAQEAARELGIEIDQAATGGGSDGNFTSALGIPTLDGLGAVGEGAHAPNESIVINRIAERVALLAALLARL